MQLAELVTTSHAVAEVRGKLAKVDLLATLLRALAPDERASAATWLAGELRHGKLGLGYAALRAADQATPPADAPTLTIADVERSLDAIAAAAGTGASKARKLHLGALFAAATSAERALLAALIMGELRQGALAGVVVDAVARAAAVPIADVRRALMLSGDLGAVAAAALADGRAGLAGFAIAMFRPLLPMLASPADDIDDALGQLGEAVLEHKLDGARIQLHKDGDDVRVYSRGLHDVSATVPELLALGRALPARRLILDGEIIALRPDGRPYPFQITMRRFGKATAATDDLALHTAFFDALVVDDDVLLDRPTRERLAALDVATPATARIPRLVTADAEAARGFLAAALAAGHEGVMAKALDAPYDAGSRGASWLKIKKVHTLDLVILAVEWGSGRRKGLLSNLHLGARDGRGSFVMLGKTFKGLTDEILAWQTRELAAREVAREDHIVHVRPELVAEIAFNDVQASTRYPGGVALRLARLIRYRPDKRAEDADTLATVRAIARADGVDLDPDEG